MKSDVEERLRGMAVEGELVRAMTPTEHATLLEAADTIAALRRENEELRKAVGDALDFIDDASIEDGQWHWLHRARAMAPTPEPDE